MSEDRMFVTTAEEQLLSKEFINILPKERLSLLLKAKKYLIVKKRTSAEAQIKEMIDFYNLCCFMLVQYFPNEQAKNNFLLLNFIDKQDNIYLPEQLEEAFHLLHNYEDLENKIIAIQMLFYQYESFFPDLYQSYNLEGIASESISDIIENTNSFLNENPLGYKKIINRWGLL